MNMYYLSECRTSSRQESFDAEGNKFLSVFSFGLLGGPAVCQPSVGPSTLRIVRNHDVAPPIQFAVGELVKYFALMGNAPPAVVENPKTGDICVGMIPNDASSEQRRAIEACVRGNPDSFVIRTLGDAPVIYGGSSRANLYGVYHYLETLGVRWYFPGGRKRICTPCRGQASGLRHRAVPFVSETGNCGFFHHAWFQ